MVEDKSLEAIRYKRGSLQLLDQKKLPHESVYVEVPDSDAAWLAIKDMVVRGAPAIAVTAALALAVELEHLQTSYQGGANDAATFIEKRLKFLVSSRPTAVNLADASDKLQRLTSQAAAQDGATAKTVFSCLIEAAEQMLVDDVVSNKAIGEYGAKAILRAVGVQKNLCVLTHCNTGSLATAGYGTALGVIRSLFFQGKIETAYCTETRPYNQGSRLTAYELVHDKIPSVLIADSAAASLMASGRVHAVVVGADRIAANGDTANKIGTFSLALAAHQLGVPFFVAAPLTTVDLHISSGDEIIIEERSKTEITRAFGGGGPEIAASGIGVWNPAFDVTPAKYITGIITDTGVVWRDEKTRRLDVGGFATGNVKYVEVDPQATLGDVAKEDGNGDLSNGDLEEKRKYYPLDESAASEYLAKVPSLAERLGGSSKEWSIKEVGDGNMNYVYIVVGPRGSMVLKQALPYVRCVGESWSMTLERAYFEAKALRKEFELVPELVPEVYHFDHPMAVIAMRYCEPPHIILRKGLIKGIVYPHLAEHISDFMSKTLFYTSLLALDTHKHKEASAQSYANVEMCRLTEQVIFSEPYMEAGNNRWTSPQLDEDARAIREDIELKAEVAELKARFCERTQALLHGDLHTGSIMATETSTQVIDPEFSFYGPMGFDVGAFIANLILAYYSQDGHSSSTQGDREDYKKWILQTVSDSWTLFAAKFKSEWDRSWDTPGDAYVPAVYNTPEAKELSQKRFMEELFCDSLGFAAAKMIRRIVGIAHVEDFEAIADKDVRAACERKALNCAKLLMKQRRQLSSIAQVLDLVRGQ